jgi:hypothetical protein
MIKINTYTNVYEEILKAFNFVRSDDTQKDVDDLKAAQDAEREELESEQQEERDEEKAALDEEADAAKEEKETAESEAKDRADEETRIREQKNQL